MCQAGLMALTCPSNFPATALTSFAAVWPLRACAGLISCMDGSSLGHGLAGPSWTCHVSSQRETVFHAH